MRYFHILFCLVFLSCETSKNTYSGKDLLEKSIQKHDPKGEWKQAEFTLRIQEPRTQNPDRFSEVYLNNQNNAFSLKRNRDHQIATYAVNANGSTTVLLNDEVVQDSLRINQFMLQPTRVQSYQEFYLMLLGLPMSLNEETIAEIGEVSEITFNEKEAYSVLLQLKKPVFSILWKVYISKNDFSLLGVDLISETNPNTGERLYFDKIIDIGSIQIPRIRHWYDWNGTYNGTDVIVKKLK